MDKPSLSDIFSGMSANETILVAKDMKNPNKLWGEFWLENEVCCLFADANVGKSILAVQIGDAIAKTLKDGESVLYYDFELSKKQFELRYTNKQTEESHLFSNNFIRIELNCDSVRDYCEYTNTPFDDALIGGIEANIKKYNSKIIIVDNLSWLVNMKDSATTAGKLMKNLCSLKNKYGMSILVLSHTPKRNLGSPLTQNSLSGSKKLTNFFDAMFAVGISVKDPNVRYVKQIKVRTGAFKHGADNVELYRIAKANTFLGFDYIGTSSEEEELKGNARREPSVAKKKATKKVRKERSSLSRHQINTIREMATKAFKTFNCL